MAQPTVFIIDDDEAVCESLSWLLTGIQLNVEIYHDGLAFLSAYRPHANGCIVLDIRMPGISGLDLQDELNKRHNRLPIIFITGHGDIPMAVKAMQAGAFNFITKPFHNQTLLEQIQRAIRQQKAPAQIQFAESLSKLTQREKTILEQIVAGKMNKEIAHELGIALSTVELHRSKLMQKLGVKNVAELIKSYILLNS